MAAASTRPEDSGAYVKNLPIGLRTGMMSRVGDGYLQQSGPSLSHRSVKRYVGVADWGRPGRFSYATCISLRAHRAPLAGLRRVGG